MYYIQQNYSWHISEIPTRYLQLYSTIKNRNEVSFATALSSTNTPPHFVKLPGANLESHIYVIRIHMFAYAHQIQISHLELKCAPLAYSYSLIMKIARDNSSPIRFWLTSERQSWTARSMYLILPNICQQSRGALN